MEIDLNDTEGTAKALQSLRDLGVTQCRLVVTASLTEALGGSGRLVLTRFPKPPRVTQIGVNHTVLDWRADVHLTCHRENQMNSLADLVVLNPARRKPALKALNERFGENCIERLTWREWLFYAI